MIGGIYLHQFCDEANKMISERSVKDVSKPISISVNRILLSALAEPVKINPRFDLYSDLWNFDWSDSGQDKNWWWKVQQLPSLGWGANDLSELEEKHIFGVLQLNNHVLNDWSQYCLEKNSKSPYAWNDLAAAFRAKNLYLWGSWLVVNERDSQQCKRVKNLVDLHIEWLVEDKNWSKGTNHGFFQSIVLLEISQGWNHLYGQHMTLALTRLESEIDQQFTEEGVHVENSPGYHKTMLSRIKSLKDYLDDVNLALPSIKFEQLVENASKFDNRITLPSGKLPLIGDSEEGKPSFFNTSRKEYGNFFYPKSGWFISRVKLDKGKRVEKSEFHLIFKNQHLSHYHRHDDDLSIHLAIGDQTFIGDSGLLNFNEKTSARKYVRSALAHSTFHPLGYRPNRKPVSKRNWIEQERGLVSAGSNNYEGFYLERSLQLDSRGVLCAITDELDNKTGQATEVVSSFIIPFNLDVEISGPLLKISDGHYSLGIRASQIGKSIEHLPIFEAEDTEFHPPIMSPTFGVAQQCHRVMIRWEVAQRARETIQFLVSLDSSLVI